VAKKIFFGWERKINADWGLAKRQLKFFPLTSPVWDINAI